jgi:hypothetical protein
LLAIIKACILPGTTIVWLLGYKAHLHNDGLTHHSESLCEFHGTWILTNTIEPPWMHVKVNLRSCWEKNVKCVINGLRSSLLAAFDDVFELIVKCCV